MELALGGVLVAIFLGGFGYLATEIRGLRDEIRGVRENEIKGLRGEMKGLREEMNTRFSELRGELKTLTERYIAHLERHR